MNEWTVAFGLDDDDDLQRQYDQQRVIARSELPSPDFGKVSRTNAVDQFLKRSEQDSFIKSVLGEDEQVPDYTDDFDSFMKAIISPVAPATAPDRCECKCMNCTANKCHDCEAERKCAACNAYWQNSNKVHRTRDGNEFEIKHTRRADGESYEVVRREPQKAEIETELRKHISALVPAVAKFKSQLAQVYGHKAVEKNSERFEDLLGSAAAMVYEARRSGSN